MCCLRVWSSWNDKLAHNRKFSLTIVRFNSLFMKKYIARKQFDWLSNYHNMMVVLNANYVYVIHLANGNDSFILLGGCWGTLGGGGWGTLGGGCWGTLGGGRWGYWCLVIGGHRCFLDRLDGLLLHWVCPLFLHNCDTGDKMANFRNSVVTFQWTHGRSLDVVWHGWSLVVGVSYCLSLDEPDNIILRCDHFNVLHESSLCNSNTGREIGTSVCSLQLGWVEERIVWGRSVGVRGVGWRLWRGDGCEVGRRVRPLDAWLMREKGVWGGARWGCIWEPQGLWQREIEFHCHFSWILCKLGGWLREWCVQLGQEFFTKHHQQRKIIPSSAWPKRYYSKELVNLLAVNKIVDLVAKFYKSIVIILCGTLRIHVCWQSHLVKEPWHDQLVG